jgi:hypothetical protein
VRALSYSIETVIRRSTEEVFDYLSGTVVQQRADHRRGRAVRSLEASAVTSD